MTKRQKSWPSEVVDRLQPIVRTSLLAYRKWPLNWRTVSVVLVVSIIFGGVIIWLLPEDAAPRARQYTAFKSCLLTNSKGISEQPASGVWQGMQQASLKTHSKVQYLANTEVKSTNAFPYLGTLVQTRCDLIIAVGDAQTTAVSSSAGSHPHTQFVVVGTTANLPNVTSVTSVQGDVPNQIAELVISASG